MLLVDGAGQLVFGVYLAHQNTTTATADVLQLTRGEHPFLIAVDTLKRLTLLLKWRATHGPRDDAYVWSRLAAGIDARRR